MNYDYCNGRIHTIQKGDTLYKISGMYHVPLALILRANPYVDIYNLQVGEKLCIPGGFDNETKPPRPGCTFPGCPMPEEKPSRPGCSLPGCQMPEEKPENPGGSSMSGFIFIVKDVQSLQSILERFGITLEDLLRENTLGNIMLQPGTAIRIPEMEDNMEDVSSRPFRGSDRPSQPM